MGRIRSMAFVSILVVAGMAGTCPAQAQSAPKPSDNWLLEAPDDAERFKRIQQMFGGFSAAMMVVAERYNRTYDALADENYDLAVYHWKKIREAIELGFLRRPGREANSVTLFLNGPWQPAMDALTAKDRSRAREAFQAGRSACMMCHAAEKVPFMNDQPIFRRTAAFP